MIIKIDFKKAYEKLEWCFLERVMEAWGFCENFRSLITGHVTIVSFSLLINGSVTRDINLKRRLRQGDPISPMLFILRSEFLSRLFNREENEGNLHGIKIDRRAPAMYHLMYTNDLLFMCQANETNAKSIRKSMDKYCRWSGQEVNEKKSNIFFSRNTSAAMRRKVKQKLSLKEMGTQGIYLGNSLVLGKNKRKEFGRIKEKVFNRVQG